MLKNGKGIINTGLTEDEEKAYLPYFLKKNSTDVGFMFEIQEYYKNFTVRIPEEGLSLDITMNPDTGLAQNPFDYIQYAMLMASGQVSTSNEAATSGNNLAIMTSEADTRKAIHNTVALGKQASAIFLKLKQEQYLTYLYVLKGKGVKEMLSYKLDDPELTIEDLEVKLNDLVYMYPHHIIAISKDKEAELKMKLEIIISRGAFKRLEAIGVVLYGSEKVGSNIEECLVWLNDPLNQEKVTEIKAKYNV